MFDAAQHQSFREMERVGQLKLTVLMLS